MKLLDWFKQHKLATSLSAYLIFKIVVGLILLVYFPELILIYIVIKGILKIIVLINGLEWFKQRLDKAKRKRQKKRSK